MESERSVDRGGQWQASPTSPYEVNYFREGIRTARKISFVESLPNKALATTSSSRPKSRQLAQAVADEPPAPIRRLSTDVWHISMRPCVSLVALRHSSYVFNTDEGGTAPGRASLPFDDLSDMTASPRMKINPYRGAQLPH